MADDLLSLREAAAGAGLGPSHLRLLARTGRLDAHELSLLGSSIACLAVPRVALGLVKVALGLGLLLFRVRFEDVCLG